MTSEPQFKVTLEELKPLLAGIEANLRESIERSASPWTDRTGAAAYCCCEVSTIDKAANRGEIKRHYGNGKPMFKKSGGKGSLDYWIEGKAAGDKANVQHSTSNVQRRMELQGV